MKKSNALLSIGLICVLDAVLILFVSRDVNFGIIFPAMIGAYLILWGLIERHIVDLPNKFKLPVLFRISQIGFWIWLVTFVLVQFVIFSSAIPNPDENADYVMILGGGLRNDELSATLLERMKVGLVYLENHPNAKVIVTGGTGFGDTRSEADAMKEFLVQKGIEENRIITEDKSTSTMENMKFSKAIIEKVNPKESYSINIITNDFHLFRAKIIGKRNGFVVSGIPAHTPMYILPNTCAREYLAIIKSLLFDW